MGANPGSGTTRWRVRRAALGDAAPIAALAGQLGYPATVEEIARRLAVSAGDPFSAVFVAEAVDGRVMGWAEVMARRLLVSPLAAELTGLVVDAAARGSGAGRALLRAAEGWALERGLASCGCGPTWCGPTRTRSTSAWATSSASRSGSTSGCSRARAAGPWPEGARPSARIPGAAAPARPGHGSRRRRFGR